jgi:hypothetical protein
LDADKGTLSFAKNSGELRLAFTDLPTNIELFPVVVFYSLNPGEKVIYSKRTKKNLKCKK